MGITWAAGPIEPCRSRWTPKAWPTATRACFRTQRPVPCDSRPTSAPRNSGNCAARLVAGALAAAELAGQVENNLSVVLLLEWHGRRLLFSGDAEWSDGYGGEVSGAAATAVGT